MTTTTSDFIESDPRTCLVDGTWSGYDITCGRVCSPLLNPNNGKVKCNDIIMFYFILKSEKY